MHASTPRQNNAQPDAPPGLFAGKYRLIRLLGKGAMGEVWLAEEEGPRNFRRRVAVKRLVASPEVGEYARDSFFAEAQVVARLDHPNVVRLIELGTADGSVYLVLDYVDGPAIDRVLKKMGAFSPRAVAYIGREIARALEAVHNLCDDDGRSCSVVHRDVSPSNILIARDGRVRLTDFGVARISGFADEETEASAFKGKLPYMPPEQARGEPLDGRADVFSLGLTLLEALTGRRVRKAETKTQLIKCVASMPVPRARELVPDLWPPLAYALDAATEIDPAKRTSDAGTMAADFERILAGMGPNAEQEARNELKERVKAYIIKAGPVSGSGYRFPPRQGSSVPPAPRADGRSVPPSSPGAAPLRGAACSAPPPRAAPEPFAARRSAPEGERSVRGNGVAALVSPPVHFLDFDGPEEAPVRRQKMTSTPEDELRLMRAASSGASEATGRSAMLPGGLDGLDEATAEAVLSASALRRKRRIFFAGLLLLGVLAASRLLVAAGC